MLLPAPARLRPPSTRTRLFLYIAARTTYPLSQLVWVFFFLKATLCANFLANKFNSREIIIYQDNFEKSEKHKLRISCPKCGRSLRGATSDMTGDTGVCPKCKAEFTINYPEED